MIYYASELQKERDEIARELETTKTLYKESQNLNQLLQGKCEYSERLASQLEQENKLLQDVEEENKELQQTINRLKEKSDKLASEVTQALDQQEKDFEFEVRTRYIHKTYIFFCKRKKNLSRNCRKSMKKRSQISEIK